MPNLSKRSAVAIYAASRLRAWLSAHRLEQNRPHVVWNALPHATLRTVSSRRHSPKVRTHPETSRAIGPGCTSRWRAVWSSSLRSAVTSPHRSMTDGRAAANLGLLTAFTRRCSTPTGLEDLAGKWQAAILKAEQNRPRLRVVSD
jgi:hypothetical protein